MPWRGVTVNEERQRFFQEYKLGYYSVSDLADRFSVSRQTADKWIRRHRLFGDTGFHELSRRPYNSPSQTDPDTAQELATLRKAHPSWGARKLLDLIHHRDASRHLPSLSTACRILLREGLARSRRRLPRTMTSSAWRRSTTASTTVLLLLPDRSIPLAAEQDRGYCLEGTSQPAPDRPGPKSVSDVLIQM
ncbi:MAG TPA: helix-turn-helix domain-containing protein [Anaerolineales bacterium]|nr:helix-turn-helix domain-containing protein [Anaerolineales bacterium]HLE05372.1 helix-turn-helix domain-containing protein [Anaerolineales bacterium]